MGKRLLHFLQKDLWSIRLDKESGRKYFFIKQLRIFLLALKGFKDDKCVLNATALTYYTVFSVVPVIALTFAIAKGFNFEEDLKKQILDKFSEHQGAVNSALEYAHNMLENAKGGVIAGVGILLLIFSVVRLLASIEDAFNDIWQINKGRTWIRKFTDYTTILIVSPILILLSGSINVIIASKFSEILNYMGLTEESTFLVTLLLRTVSFLLLFLMFTFMYMVIPNTKVDFKAALKAAFYATILFEIVKWAYLYFQIGVTQYNQIYGSFAALPLFLVWIQLSWFIVLFGAELAFSYQNVKHYELEHEINNLSHRYVKTLSILIMYYITKNFSEAQKPLGLSEISDKLDLPERLSIKIINTLEELGLVNEIKPVNKNSYSTYQPALSEKFLTINFILQKLDTKGVNEIPVGSVNELSFVQNKLSQIDNILDNSRENILVKDLMT
ncbi:MAG: YhjD/YihY/BrkB family envelope integrity protein [Bacteroidota bacterium]|jgi:membrane protein